MKCIEPMEDKQPRDDLRRSAADRVGSGHPEA